MTTATKFEKVLHVGKTEYGNVFLKVDFDGSKLSISGVEGPMRNGDARGGCGQIIDTLANITEYREGWDAASVARLAEIWRAWHLNDMRAGCEHQRAERWNERPIDPSKPTNSYGKHFEGQQQDSWNMLAWVTRKEHPEGLLSHPCPTCGYKYGTAWLKEEVPAAIIEELAAMPESTVAPAWV